MAVDPVATLGSILSTGSASTPGVGSASSVKSAATAVGVGGASGGGIAGEHVKDFGEVLAQLISGTAQTVKAGEAASVAGMQGQASVQQVVEAVMKADQSLQVALAVRDKVVSAYLEISRMSI
jgi:flagellar hook-basal body complex protein FliE